MLLAIDIGNTNIVIGLSEKEVWRQVWRMPTQPDSGIGYYKSMVEKCVKDARITQSKIEKVVISCVVPSLMNVFKQLIINVLNAKLLIIDPNVYPKIKIKIDNPGEIGTDLLANAIAANHLYNKDCIVVDFGTALSFTTVTAKGEILGVTIAPGLKTAIKALAGNAAQLPEVPLIMPDSALGKNTIHAIQAGILEGYVGLIKHLLAKTRAEVGEHFIAIATGGLSSILEPLREEFYSVEPNLTLDGLRIMAGFLSYFDTGGHRISKPEKDWKA